MKCSQVFEWTNPHLTPWLRCPKIFRTIICQKAFVFVTISASTCQNSLISTTSPSSAGWRLSRTCHCGWHRLLTLWCGSLLLTQSTWFFGLGSFYLVLSPPAWHGGSEFEAPNYCVSPLGCVLICHIMSHLHHCISNIPSITGRLRGEFKIGLLQAIWVRGTQMCSLSSSVWHTLKVVHSSCLT